MQELGTILILTTLVFIWIKYIAKRKLIKIQPIVWVLLCCALGGVLPIMISLKQSTFYAIPTFPLFSIAFALLIIPYIADLISKVKVSSFYFNLFRTSSVFLCLTGIILLLSNINEIGRDKSKLTDIWKVIDTTGSHSQIILEENFWSDWSYYAYFYRYGHVSLFTSETKNKNFYLTPKGVEPINKESYQKLNLELKTLDLYKRK